MKITGTTAGCADAHVHATGLFAESWFHRDPLAPLGAPAGNYLLAALGLHARAKSVCLRSLAPVGLECTLGHEKYLLLIRSTVLGQTVSINEWLDFYQRWVEGRDAIREVRGPGGTVDSSPPVLLAGTVVDCGTASQRDA